MHVLIGCEFSGIVRDAFIARGHDAVSCDLLPTEREGPHLQMDVLEVLDWGWDLAIFHPPCTYLTCAGNKYFKEEYAHRFPDRWLQRFAAVDFVYTLLACSVPRICLENPVGVISTYIRKPDQIIQPYQFGHTVRKTTCLWLKNLSPLCPTKTVEPWIKTNRNGKTASVVHDAALRLPPDDRWKFRSRTYWGIADAMADQWGRA